MHVATKSIHVNIGFSLHKTEFPLLEIMTATSEIKKSLSRISHDTVYGVVRRVKKTCSHWPTNCGHQKQPRNASIKESIVIDRIINRQRTPVNTRNKTKWLMWLMRHWSLELDTLHTAAVSLSLLLFDVIAASPLWQRNSYCSMLICYYSMHTAARGMFLQILS